MSADDPQQLMSFALGDNSWPPNPDEAWAEVKFSAEYAVDEQKPAGKDDPTVKNTGRKARKVTLILHWTDRMDAEARVFLRTVSPVGVNQGKAWEISHVDAELYNVDSVELTTMGEIARTASTRDITLGGISWIKKPAAKAGTGVKSADKPVEWKDTPQNADHFTFKTADGNTIDMGAGPVAVKTRGGQEYGFGTSDAPAAEVPE